MSGTVPNPTPIYRIVHINNLDIFLFRNALHSPSHQPNDGRRLRFIHDPSLQDQRRVTPVTCGPCGCIHDYVPFYFGPRSPMLYRIHKGTVENYDEGQEPIIYLVSSVQAVVNAKTSFVFTDGHANARFTSWFDNTSCLVEVDWSTVHARTWRDDANDNDRQRRKQAEFLVHKQLAWSLIEEIGVIDQQTQTQVLGLLSQYPNIHHPAVKIRSEWYYY